jgi:superfamily I DNA and RNA helicase
LEQVEGLKADGVLQGHLFDAVYLDEGQDFEVEEYRLLLGLIRPDTRTGEKNLIVCYDDAQNLYARPRPKWADLGLRVDVGQRSRVMKECHRNTREVIEFAFNVLVGSGASAGTRVQTRAFADTETLKRLGLVTEDESRVRVHFARRIGPAPVVRAFQDRQAEYAWVATEAARLMTDEQVRPDDILVVAETAEGLSALAGRIRELCPSLAGFSHPHLGGEKDEHILKPGRVTITTTRSAKGYDSYVVFVAMADRFPLTPPGRASFYVGCSRARLMLYVTGVGGDGTLVEEAGRVVKALEAAGQEAGPGSETPRGLSRLRRLLRLFRGFGSATP